MPSVGGWPSRSGRRRPEPVMAGTYARKTCASRKTCTNGQKNSALQVPVVLDNNTYDLGTHGRVDGQRLEIWVFSNKIKGSASA